MSLEHVLLGLLHEPKTADELQTALSGHLRHLWSAPAETVRAALAELEDSGRADGWSAPDSSSPARIYRRTESGTSAFTAWLVSGPQAGVESSPAPAQLRFQWQLEDPDYTPHFLAQFREQLALLLESALAHERALLASFSEGTSGMDDRHFHEYLSAKHGTKLMRAQLEWCDECSAQVRDRARSTERPPERSSDAEPLP